MEQILAFFGDYSIELLAGSAILSLLSFIIVLINSRRTSKIIKKYKRLTRGVNNKNLEALLNHHHNQVEEALTLFREFKCTQDMLSKQLSHCIQNIGIVRYNPFSQVGSDQSFSIALLDSHENGVVITGLYSRDSSVTFGKPIVNGLCEYPLSDEEKQAIQLALTSRHNQQQ